MRNQKYKILIGEPWDFTGPDGDNIIIGKIIKKFSDRCILFESDKEVHYEDDNVIGKFLLLVPRHNEIPTNYNGLLLMKFNDVDKDKDSFELFKDSKFVLIGSLYKI